MAVPSPVGDIKIVSVPNKKFMLNTMTLKVHLLFYSTLNIIIFCLCFLLVLLNNLNLIHSGPSVLCGFRNYLYGRKGISRGVEAENWSDTLLNF